MAQSKEELISRQELLQVISGHTAALGGSAPLQTAVLAWVKQLVLAMPAKAALVDLVHCGECAKWKPEPHPQCPTLGKCYREKGSYRSSDDFAATAGGGWTMAKNDGYMIEREALLEMLEAMEEAAVAGTENDGTDGTTCILEPVVTTTREMEDMIASLPAVRLTHCQDCELWQRADGQKIGKCCHFSRDDLSDFIKAITYMTNETDFCSNARRIVTDGIDLRG